MQPTDRPPFILSYTYMDYLRCPFKYLRYVLEQYEREEGDSIAATRGDLCHQIIASYGTRLAKANRPKLSMWFNEAAADIFHINETPKWMQDDVMDTLGDFAETWMIRPQSVHHFEQKMAVNRWDWKKVPLNPADKRYRFHKDAVPQDVICGTADHIEIRDDRAYITDFKSHFKRYSYDDALDNPQLELYAWLLFLHFDEITEVNVTEWGFRWGSHNKAGHTWRFPELDEKVRPKIIASFELLDAAFEAKGLADWQVRPGTKQCQYCTLRCDRKVELLRRSA